MSKLLNLLAGQLQTEKRHFCSAVLLAAGSSARMEGLDKLTAPLRGVPVLLYALRDLERAARVDEIILVAAPERLQEFEALVAPLCLKKLRCIAAGGATRADSVACGLALVSKRAKLVATHDGARPLAGPALIDAVVERAAQTGAAVAGLPVHDTVKRAEGAVVCGSVDRETLVRMQTPQVFDADLLRAALTRAKELPEPPTDDVTAVQALGMAVHIVPGSERNLKITTREDLELARALVEAKHA